MEKKYIEPFNQINVCQIVDRFSPSSCNAMTLFQPHLPVLQLLHTAPAPFEYVSSRRTKDSNIV